MAKTQDQQQTVAADATFSLNGGAPPFNRQAEKAVIGGCLVMPEEVIPCVADLTPNDFYLRAHRLIFEVVRDLANKGRAVDTLTVADALRQRGQLEEVGGASYLAEVAATFTTSTSVTYYVEILKRDARRRWGHDLGLQLAEAFAKGDFEDAAATVEEVRALLDAHDADVGAGDEVRFYEDLQRDKAPAVDWLVDGLIPHPRLIGLVGKRAALKTWCALHLGLAVASGRPVFGQFEAPQPQPVLYLNADNPPGAVESRLRQLAKAQGEPPRGMLAVAHFPRVGLRTSEGLRGLRRLLRETEPTLVIVDSVARIWEVRDELDNAQIAEALGNLRSLSNDFDCTFLILHHLRKAPAGTRDAGDGAESVRGGSEIVNLLDTLHVLRRKGREAAAKVVCAKMRDAPEPEPFAVRLVALGEGAAVVACEAAQNADTVEAAAGEILRWLEEQAKGRTIKAAEVVEALGQRGLSRRTVYRALGLLVKKGQLERSSRGTYRLVGGGGEAP